jgi:mono/diheme cytochrome c family protein
MRARAMIVAALLVGSIVLRAQPTRRTRDHNTRWAAPAAESARVNPLTNRSDVAAGGKKVFQQRCATCHAEDASGTADAPDLTRSTVQRQSDGQLFWKITSGNTRTGMPTFSFLPSLQRWQLVLYIRSQSDNRTTKSALDQLKRRARYPQQNAP